MAPVRERWVFVCGVLIGAVLLACFLIELLLGMPGWLVALPFALSLFFCGMPHGAMDWYVHRRFFGGGSLGISLLTFLPYTVLCVLCAVALVVAPVAYLAFFLLLTLLHFGRADARLRTGCASASIPETVRGVARAAAIVALPFAFQPVETGAAIARISALIGGPATLPSTLVAILGVFGAVGIAVWLIDAAATSRRKSSIAGLLPLAVLATSALLPPLFSVGVWFLVWHALRECVVLGDMPSRPIRSIVRTHMRSVPLMLPTLGLALTLGILASAPAGVLGLAAVTLTLYAIFTPAHHLLQELASAKEPQPGTGAG